MSKNFASFVETIEAPNTKKVVNFLSEIGNYDYTDCSVEDLEKVILNMKPNSPRAIITICYIIRLYAKYLNDDHLYKTTKEIDYDSLWEKAKPNAAQKYISNSLFNEIYHDIGVFEELNSHYYQMLFRAVYEGIFNDDMSVIKNLKSSDITENIVTLHTDDGCSYELEISHELANGLRELSHQNFWERNNRYRVINVKMFGSYPDTCFKSEIRGGNKENGYRYVFYNRLRKISNDYLGYKLCPFDLFVSGIMHRISCELKGKGISLEEAFVMHNRDKEISSIFLSELKRVNYNIKVGSFRQMVRGHIDIFE